MPLYLAGRENEKKRFKRLLDQKPVLRNTIITGLRGVGKTVLLENLKPASKEMGWLWTGNDLSESASLTEDRICRRLITDLSLILRPILVKSVDQLPIGFARQPEKFDIPLTFDDLWQIYDHTPGLSSDKIKALLFEIRDLLEKSSVKGIIFSYDEAQNLSDHAIAGEYPLSTLLDSFSALQRDHHPVQMMLVLPGLPTLLPKLNEARTYTERMFDVMTLAKLDHENSKLAIVEPIEISKSKLRFAEKTVEEISNVSGGYPYFIQYICKEVYDTWIDQATDGIVTSVPSKEIVVKLDQDFFAPRWDNATDRQQEFMWVIAGLPNCETEFTQQEIVRQSRQRLKKGFSPSHTSQILKTIEDKGLVFRSRRSKYCFAVPLMSEFIKRQNLNYQNP